MTNVLHEVEHVGEEIVKGIEFPFKFAAKAEKVLATIITDDPAARTVLTALVQKCEAIGADTLKDIGEKGLNLQDDASTIAAIQALGSYIKDTVVPFIEQVYGQVAADVK